MTGWADLAECDGCGALFISRPLLWSGCRRRRQLKTANGT
jgi:hypothetical protein